MRIFIKSPFRVGADPFFYQHTRGKECFKVAEAKGLIFPLLSPSEFKPGNQVLGRMGMRGGRFAMLARSWRGEGVGLIDEVAEGALQG